LAGCAKGGGFVKRFCRGRTLGFVLAGAGILLILAVILPSQLWWFFLGVALILIGILFLQS
jgi:hypothetical protein